MLSAGRMLIAGGRATGGKVLRDCAVLDLDAASWSACTAHAALARCAHAASTITLRGEVRPATASALLQRATVERAGAVTTAWRCALRCVRTLVPCKTSIPCRWWAQQSPMRRTVAEQTHALAARAKPWRCMVASRAQASLMIWCGALPRVPAHQTRCMRAPAFMRLVAAAVVNAPRLRTSSNALRTHGEPIVDASPALRDRAVMYCEV